MSSTYIGVLCAWGQSYTNVVEPSDPVAQKELAELTCIGAGVETVCSGQPAELSHMLASICPNVDRLHRISHDTCARHSEL